MRVGFPTTDCTSRVDSPLSSYTNLLRKNVHDIFFSRNNSREKLKLEKIENTKRDGISKPVEMTQ